MAQRYLPRHFDRTAGAGGTGGIDSADQWSRTFTSAGTFEYVCRKHELWGQRASVTVKLGVTLLSNPTRFRIAPGSRAVTGAWRHQVQAQAPPTGSITIATIAAAMVFLTPTERGDYAFRARLTNVSTGQQSEWSPLVEAHYQALRHLARRHVALEPSSCATAYPLTSGEHVR